MSLLFKTLSSFVITFCQGRILLVKVYDYLLNQQILNEYLLSLNLILRTEDRALKRIQDK